jgi:hypothetical protein
LKNFCRLYVLQNCVQEHPVLWFPTAAAEGFHEIKARISSYQYSFHTSSSVKMCEMGKKMNLACQGSTSSYCQKDVDPKHRQKQDELCPDKEGFQSLLDPL